jgi:hypothetical protein
MGHPVAFICEINSSSAFLYHCAAILLSSYPVRQISVEDCFGRMAAKPFHAAPAEAGENGNTGDHTQTRQSFCWSSVWQVVNCDCGRYRSKTTDKEHCARQCRLC